MQQPIAARDGDLHVRVSDAEREQVVSRLTAACAEGRLTLEEMGTRVTTAYTAVTRGDLVPLTSDLPAPTSAPLPPVATPATKLRKRRHVTVMGSLHRRVSRIGERTTVVTVMGESHLDLRGAVPESLDLELRLRLLMGEQVVIVPDGIEVEVSGFVFMGEKKVEIVDVRPRPGVPRLHIRVVGVMGEVHIRGAKDSERGAIDPPAPAEPAP